MAARARVAGVLALAYGIGLRLDFTCQRAALALIVTGLALALGGLVGEAFVSRRGEG